MWQGKTNKGKVVHRSKRPIRYRESKPFRFSDLVRVLRTVIRVTDATLILSSKKNIQLFVEYEFLTLELIETVYAAIGVMELPEKILELITLFREELKQSREKKENEENGESEGEIQPDRVSGSDGVGS